MRPPRCAQLESRYRSAVIQVCSSAGVLGNANGVKYGAHCLGLPKQRSAVLRFDPRGTNRSTALRCFGNPKQWAPYFTPFAFPSTPAEEQTWMTADLYLDSNCAQRGGRIADHMATADVARDLDVLRQAVGDAKLTYAGVSYGTFLGQTYANMFPDKVRAVVIDGVL